MISDLPVFQVFSAMARHAAETQRVTAENVAHTGEPGYKAQEVESFSEFIERAQRSGTGGTLPTVFKTTDADGPAAPNGNTVNLEQEVFKSAEAGAQHELALTVYTKSIDLLRTALGRRG